MDAVACDLGRSKQQRRPVRRVRTVHGDKFMQLFQWGWVISGPVGAVQLKKYGIAFSVACDKIDRPSTSPLLPTHPHVAIVHLCREYLQDSVQVSPRVLAVSIVLELLRPVVQTGRRLCG